MYFHCSYCILLGVILFFLLGSWRSLGKDSDTTFTASVEGTYSNNVPFGVAKYPNSHLIHLHLQY